MNRKGIISIIGAVTLALALVGTASALTGVPCVVGGTGAQGDGVAVIADGFNSGTTAGIPFEFTAKCSGGPVTGCAVGTLDNNQCTFGEHRGSFVYCAGGCTVTCGGNGSPCTGANVDTAVIGTTGPCLSGTFDGLCIGTLCVGSTTAEVLYALAFDTNTISDAGAKCGPTGNGQNINNASFSGLIVY